MAMALAFASTLTACGNEDGTTGRAPPLASNAEFYTSAEHAPRQVLIAEGEGGAPREIRLFFPDAHGNYPLLQFQHGFVSDVDTYTNLLDKLAAFGFVIAAPQMYEGDPSTAPSVPEEAAAAVDVLTWVQNNVNGILAAQADPVAEARADINATGMLGHSRGGQVAWRVLFDHAGETNARAIAGVDPVDGDAPPFPPGGTGGLVTDDEGAFQFPHASLILGMGLGNTGAPGFECAPENRNYRLFYDASAPPRYEITATGHGHSDMLNGDEPSAVCAGAVDGSREALRVFIAGQLAAYFGSVLRGEGLFELLRNLDGTPVPTEGRFED